MHVLTDFLTHRPAPPGRDAHSARHPLALAISLAMASTMGMGLVQDAHAQAYPTPLPLSSLDGTIGFRIDGEAERDLSANAVSGAGDINGDGIDDLVIGGTNAYGNGPDRAGQSYVIFGKENGFDAVLPLASLDGTNGFRIAGVSLLDLSGYAVSGAGDVNGDGIDDLIIGAPAADPTGLEYAGSSYVVFGKTTGFNGLLELADLDGTNGFRIDGAAAGGRSGRAVSAAGDVNGDGIGDLVVGAPFADPGSLRYAGSSYVVFGTNGARDDLTSGALALAGLDGTNGFRVDGVAEYDGVGFAVSNAGDVNGDGFDDALIGLRGGGGGYVVFGTDQPFGPQLDLSSLDGTNGFRLDGIDYSGLGSSISSAGDVNGDGVDDIVISAAGADLNGTDSGSTYVVFGDSAGFDATFALGGLDGTNGFRLDGPAGQRSGSAVSGAGDVNGDGFDDLLIATGLSGPTGPDRADSGYVVFGKASGFSPTFDLADLRGADGFQIDVTAPVKGFGIAVSDAGDIDGDGFDDLIIGVYKASYSADYSGSSYVLFGRPTPFLNLSVSEVAFGNVLVATSSSAQSIMIENTGNFDMTIGTLSLVGSNSDDFSLSSDGCSSQTVPPAANCSFDVSFGPVGAGARTAQIDIPSDASSIPDSVRVAGTGLQPIANLSTASIRFGDVIVGATSAAQIVTLENIGDGNLIIGLLNFVGNNAADFALAVDTCTGKTISPAASCVLGVDFSPSNAGARNAELSLQSNAPTSPDGVALIGAGRSAPEVLLMPDPLLFGDVALGQNETQMLIVENIGPGLLMPLAITIEGQDEPEFSVQMIECPGLELAMGEFCGIDIGFYPAQPGVRQATLRLESNDPNGPDFATLRGSNDVVFADGLED